MAPALVADGAGDAPTVKPKSPQYLEACMKEALQAIHKTTLEPPLTEADFPAEALEKIKPTTTPPTEYYKTAAETAFKGIIYDIASEYEPEDENAVVAFGNALDLALISSELDIADGGLPFILLEELFDTQTSPSCERIFKYLESRVERLTAGMEGGKGKALILLRLCNELLRRLSKAEDTIFCGRILIFLSKSFPISERSAVNLRGDFNTENITVFDELAEELDEDPMDIDEVALVGEPAKAEESKGTPKDDKPSEEKLITTHQLYTMFWSLQHDFADPTRLFDPTNFEAFKKGLAATMKKFREADQEAVKMTGTTSKADPGSKVVKASHATNGDKRKRDEEGDDEEMAGESFNPKYLTSRELFELEISDLTFRRHVLVQAMILLDFLLGLTKEAKERWKAVSKPNLSVQYSFTLSPEDEKWATHTRQQISISLQPDQLGKLFMRLINTVLMREQNWIQWKVEGCNPFDKLPLAMQELVDAKTKASDYCKPERPYPYTMGTPMLNKLWRESGDVVKVEDLCGEKRRYVPSIDDYYQGMEKDEEELKDAMFPADIEAGQQAIQTKTWKALRLASRDRFHLFNRFDDKFDEPRNDLRMLRELEEKANEGPVTKPASTCAAK